MEQGASVNSSNIMDLNSPEVLDKESSPFDSHDKDTLGRLTVSPKFTEASHSSVLPKEKHKSECRRVSFPEDDKIISGYGEPRNPWAQAKTTSTEELIQAYTQSCQQQGVKPIIKLLLQLQEIKDFSVRANSLTLKGEKLDTKVVETLEAVFKRVQFVLVDVEATSLDEDAAAALFDMIEYYESAVNVLVGFNKNLGTRGWQAAAHMMRKMSCLLLFDGHSVPLTEQAVPFVGRALRLSNTLVTLHLESASLSGRPILLIVAALRMNVTLRELFLADNHLASTDALQIANLLKCNSTLNLLDLRNNLIQDAGLCHLCVGLAGQPRTPGVGGLQTLVLWNNQISHQSMAKLSMALKATTSLSTLNLGQNVLGDDGASKLKEGLLKNRSLLRLGMVGTKLTCEGAIALAEYLAESSRIIRLDLRNNEIKFGGLMALSLAFKINYSLLRLDIDRPTSKNTLKELVEKQETMLKNIQEYSNRNKEQAILRVTSQQEKKKQSEEEAGDANPGLRYMDMTSSAVVNAGASTSQNNSNNKLATSQIQRVLPHSSVVDDSPINSPEFLPTNSVSYHQVSPVMFSSSEMQKRAALAKLHSDSSDNLQSESDQQDDVGDATTITTPMEDDTRPKAGSDAQSCGDLRTNSVSGDSNSKTPSQPQSCGDEGQNNSDSDTQSKNTTFDANEHAKEHVTSFESPEGSSSKTEVERDVTDESDSPPPPSSTQKNSIVTLETNSNDTNENVSQTENDSLEPENTSTPCIVEATNTELVDVREPNSNDADFRDDSAPTDDTDEESNVSVTHFDLHLFPKD